MFDDRLLWMLAGAGVALGSAWLATRKVLEWTSATMSHSLALAKEAATMLQTTTKLTEQSGALSDLQAVVVGLNRSVTNLVAMQTGRTIVPKADSQFGEGPPAPVSREVEIVAPPTGGLVNTGQNQRLVPLPPTELAKPT